MSTTTTNDTKKRKVVPVDSDNDDSSSSNSSKKSYAELEAKLAETKQVLLETQEKLEQALEAAAASSSSNANSNNDNNDDDDISDGEDSVQLEGNTDAWMTNYVQLREQVIVHGNCQISSQNKKLQKWVANQKLAYTHVKEGKKGKSIAPERIALLEGLGCFHWGKKFPPPPSWDEQFDALTKYCKATGNCNVAMHPTNPSAMAKWVSAQRSEYKRFRKGQSSLLSLEQISKLKNIGFKWNGPRLSKLKKRG